MNAVILKLRVLFFLTCLLSFCVNGQNLRFIYIQTENKQPFYVKMDKKYLSSSTSGYIIIAKLIEGAYPLTIGYPKNEWPELKVTLTVKDNNTGYLLRNSANQNWSLINLQTTASIVAQKLPLPEKEEVASNGDEFAKILAEVVNDPSIRQVITVKKNTEAVTVGEANKAEILEVAEPKKPESLQSQRKKSQIAKLMYDSTNGGFLLTYVDQSALENDTVKIFIPVTQNITQVKNEKKFTVKADTGILKNTDFVITEKKINANNSLNESSQTKANVANRNKPVNSKCEKTATQNEFLKLRKQMAAEENEKNMIKAANKQFINTCFTTEQIRNLGVLFITEEEKYKFYVNAFPYVADILNFSSLEDQLSDNYYKSRFKAMLNQ